MSEEPTYNEAWITGHNHALKNVQATVKALSFKLTENPEAHTNAINHAVSKAIVEALDVLNNLLGEHYIEHTHEQESPTE